MQMSVQDLGPLARKRKSQPKPLLFWPFGKLIIVDILRKRDPECARQRYQ